MRESDLESFLEQVMGPLYLTFREPPNEDLALVYFAALRPYALAEVIAATHRALRECTFFPKPAELIRLLRGAPDAAAVLAWARVWPALERGAGYYRPITFEDPMIHATVMATTGGWAGLLERVGNRDRAPVDVVTARREFLEVYTALATRGGQVTAPASLCANPDAADRPVIKMPALGEPWTPSAQPALPRSSRPPEDAPLTPEASLALIRETTRILTEKGALPLKGTAP